MIRELLRRLDEHARSLEAERAARERRRRSRAPGDVPVAHGGDGAASTGWGGDGGCDGGGGGGGE